MDLQAGNIALPLTDGLTGPALDVDDPNLGPLAWVINAAAAGEMPELADALTRGDSVFAGALYAARPTPGDDLSESRERWRAVAGEDPGDDVYLVGTSFFPGEILVPRQALQAILQGLVDLQRRTPPPQAPWLFRRDPVTAGPANGEEGLMQELEQRAVELDRLEGDAAKVEAAAQASAKRRFLLLDLDAAGLFDAAHSKEKLAWLETWGFATLLSYHLGAMTLLTYLRSPERRRYVKGAGPEPVLGAPVSVDWFRLGVQVPAGHQPYDWAGLCESIFRAADKPRSGGGEVYAGIEGKTYRLRWRTDDGSTPALLSADPVTAGS